MARVLQTGSISKTIEILDVSIFSVKVSDLMQLVYLIICSNCCLTLDI